MEKILLNREITRTLINLFRQIENMEIGYIDLDISINMRKNGIIVSDSLKENYKGTLTINLLQEYFHANFGNLYVDNIGFGCQLYFDDILNEIFIPFKAIFLVYDKFSKAKVEMLNNLRCSVENIDNIISSYKKENISIDNASKHNAQIINFDEIESNS